MSQSVKPTRSQGASQSSANSTARYGWARPAGQGALGHAAAAFARAGFTDATLVLRWQAIVGPDIARIARPAKWQDGPSGAVVTLTCEAGAAVLLQHQTRALIERLNAYLGAGRVARLKLVPGRLSDLPELPPHPAPQADFAAESPHLPDALERLGRLRARLRPERPKRTAKRTD